MAEENAPEVSHITYEQLAALEEEFEDIDLEILRQQYQISKPVYQKRTEAVAKIPGFWAIALEQAPQEIDSLISPEDSRLLADLSNITVSRPEIDDGKNGHPRSVSIRFEFKANDRFDDAVLEKHFYYRRARDGWAGLVSEPVKINWKKGKDLSEGLTDLTYNLFQARKKKGDMNSKDLPEYAALQKKLESSNAQSTSFFSWFGFVSEKRWVSVEENEQAVKDQASRKEARNKGEEIPAPEPTEADAQAEEDHEAVEVCVDGGEDVAIALAEDIWPNAIKFFTTAQEMGDISDADFEDFDDEDMEDDDEEGDEPVDIQSILQEKGDKARTKSEGGPASKKAKKNGS